MVPSSWTTLTTLVRSDAGMSTTNTGERGRMVTGVARATVSCFVKRSLLLVFALVAAAALSPATALAKEDVEATLDTRIPRNAAPGKQLDVAWTLTIKDQGTRRPFGAGGVFVQLFSRSDGKATIGVAAGDGGRTGKYRATVTVPEGGIGALAIGLAGFVSGPTGTSRSDVYFPVKNSPFPMSTPPKKAAAETPTPPPPVSGDESGSGSSDLIWLAAVLLSLAGVGLMVFFWHRWPGTPGELQN